MADAELANTLKKATKSKEDKAHPGQVEYTHWINCIADSSAIMRWYGLTPIIKERETVEQMIPELTVFIDHFNAQDKTTTKAACAALAKNMFGRKALFVSTVNTRVLDTIKFYNNVHRIPILLMAITRFKWLT